MSESLEELRNKIDSVDRRIVELLNERARVVHAIGELKANGNTEVFVPAREKRVLENVAKANTGPLSNAAVAEVYGSILAVCRALEKRLCIAYLGPEATFTHEAAKKKFGTQVEYAPATSIADVFMATEQGRADYGVVPVENSTEGVVNHTLDMFIDSELKICAEVYLRISHFLMAKCALSDVKRVYSKDQALAQSRRWLSEHLPHADLVEVASTARAAATAATEPGTAAVAPQLAAQVYGLDVLASRIEDNASNITRFLVIGRSTSGKSGNDKTAVVFSLAHKVGALHDALAAFKASGINLTMIESRPSRTRVWDWIFFAEFSGHPDDANVKQALEKLRDECGYMKVLGSWPVEDAF